MNGAEGCVVVCEIFFNNDVVVNFICKDKVFQFFLVMIIYVEVGM